ncbi:hypothetical protein GC197_04765 [bacterium]|nr:hypothetical protein [bacterium]
MNPAKLLFCALLVAVLGCNSSSENTLDENPSMAKETEEMINEEVVVDNTDSTEETLPEDAPVLTFTVEELIDHMKEDGEEKKKAFQGHWIDLTGIVYGFEYGGRSDSPIPYVTLAAPYDADSVNIYNIKKHDFIGLESPAEAWEKMKPGDEVTLRLTYDKLNGLHNGKVVAGGSPAPRVTAEQLVKDIKEDRAAATEKYDDKYWILTGNLAEKQPEKGSSSSFVGKYYTNLIKGDDETDIALDIPHLRQMDQLEPSEEVEILGKIRILDPSDVTEFKPCYIGIIDGSRVDVDKKLGK